MNPDHAARTCPAFPWTWTRRLVTFAWLLGLVTTNALAAPGVGGSIVFDPSNFAKNSLTAAETAKQVIEQVKANGLHLQQVQELMAARQPLNAMQLELASGLSSVAEVARRVDEVRGLLASLESLSDSIRNMQGRFDVRFNAAQALGLGLAAYYEQVKQKADAGARGVQKDIDADRQALARVSSAHEQVLQWTQTIRGIDSQVAGLSVLGSQMNVMVAQNAELMSFMLRDNQARHQARIDAYVAAQEQADQDVKMQEAARAAYRKSQQDLQNSLRATRR